MENKIMAIIALTIGDGCINKKGQLRLTHCKAQEEYLIWKKNYLKSLNIETNPIKEFPNGVNNGVRFSVKSSKKTKLARRILYKPTKNYYNRQLLNKLTAKHIAIWYMDDGSLSQKRRKGIVHANDLTMNTYTTKENNQILIDYFKEVWGVTFYNCKSKNHYRLSCSTKQARIFIDIVKPYVSEVKCMSHKLKVKPLI